MTYEELEALVAHGDPMAVAEALAPLSEAERKKLSVGVGKLYKSVRYGLNGDERESKEQVELRRRVTILLSKKKKLTVRHIVCSAEIAALGVCPLSVTQNILCYSPEGSDAEMVKVLVDRKPDWLERWIEKQLSHEWGSMLLSTLLAFVDAGVCEKPDSDAYVNVLASSASFVRHGFQTEPSQLRSDFLRARHDLLDDVYALFRVDTGAFLYCWDDSSPWLVHRRAKGYETWAETIQKLLATGHLDRDRLLDASISAMTTGFKQNVLSGFAKMHAALEPTDSEIAARQEAYLDLLAVPTGQVVSFALKMLKRLVKAKALDAGAFLAAGSRVFALSTKSQPKAVLSMAKPLMKKHAEHRAAGLSLALEGLTHADGDVQSAALGLLALYPDDAPSGAAERLAELLEDLPATLRGEAQEVLVALGGDAADAETPSNQGGSGIAERDADALLVELRERAASLDAGLRATLGVDEALSTFAQAGTAPPLAFSVMDAPVLASCEPIVPIETVDELLDAAAHAVEKVDSADEIERLIDGISRLCDQRTEDFEARFAPILHRILPPRDPRWDGIVINGFAPYGVPRLVLTWNDPERYEKQPKGVTGYINGFMTQRTNEVESQVRQRRPRQLLSTPTHIGGWIDPCVFISRLQQYEASDARPGFSDLIMALLRLAPDRREPALDSATGLTGTYAPAVRWALGGPWPGGDTAAPRPPAASEPPTGRIARFLSKVAGPKAETDDSTPTERARSLWLAAGRCRQPWGPLPELESAGMKLNLAGGSAAASYEFCARYGKRSEYHHDKTPVLDVVIKPAFTKAQTTGHDDRPTVLLHRKSSRWSYFDAHTDWVQRWVESCWPMNNDAVLIGALHDMTKRLDDNASSWDPNHAMLQGLFLPDRPWSEPARLAVWLGLAGKDADVRGVALDALIEAVDDGRAHPDEMADTLLILAPREHPGWLKLNRLAANLAEVARVSELHAWFVACCAQRLVGAWDKPPRDAHHLLTLLLEVMTQLRLGLDDNARTRLGSVKGSSKTAKLAKKLLTLEPDHHHPAMDAARLRMAEARIERAERWAEARP